MEFRGGYIAIKQFSFSMSKESLQKKTLRASASRLHEEEPSNSGLLQRPNSALRPYSALRNKIKSCRITRLIPDNQEKQNDNSKSKISKNLLVIPRYSKMSYFSGRAKKSLNPESSESKLPEKRASPHRMMRRTPTTFKVSRNLKTNFKASYKKVLRLDLTRLLRPENNQSACKVE